MYTRLPRATQVMIGTKPASGSYSTGTIALRHNVPVNGFWIHLIIAMIGLFLELHKQSPWCSLWVRYFTLWKLSSTRPRSSTKANTQERLHYHPKGPYGWQNLGECRSSSPPQLVQLPFTNHFATQSISSLVAVR
jgi:hypothetical protein